MDPDAVLVSLDDVVDASCSATVHSLSHSVTAVQKLKGPPEDDHVGPREGVTGAAASFLAS